MMIWIEGQGFRFKLDGVQEDPTERFLKLKLQGSTEEQMWEE